MNISYTTNKSNRDEIEQHLLSCDKDFRERLSEKTDVNSYAQKIRENAITFESWSEGILIGIVACYANDPSKKQAYITNVSVNPNYQKRGIAMQLMTNTLTHQTIRSFDKIVLKVYSNNTPAINLYKKSGFVYEEEDGEQIIMINKEKRHLVSICCATYDHAPYIRQCLDGFLMQKTDFPFEVLINDDASTDGTSDIIREYAAKYPDTIKPIYQTENQYSKGVKVSVVYNFPRAKGKYIAMCEGDDYWTDPLKLQKQVDFLEANKDFSICFHNVRVKQEKDNTIIEDNMTVDVPDITDIHRLAGGNYIHTPSVVFRKNQTVFDEMLSLGNLSAGDYVLHMLNAKHGKIKKMSDCMAIYRIHDTGVWSSKNKEYTYPKWLDQLDKIMPKFSSDIQSILMQQYISISKELIAYLLVRNENYQQIKSSYAYRVGKFFLKPLSVLKK